MDNFTTFNLFESLLWIALALLGLFVYRWSSTPERYRAMALTATVALFSFGVSDLVEIYTRGFLGPGLWWLLLWKAASLGALMTTAAWFFVVFLRTGLRNNS